MEWNTRPPPARICPYPLRRQSCSAASAIAFKGSWRRSVNPGSTSTLERTVARKRDISEGTSILTHRPTVSRQLGIDESFLKTGRVRGTFRGASNEKGKRTGAALSALLLTTSD